MYSSKRKSGDLLMVFALEGAYNKIMVAEKVKNEKGNVKIIERSTAGGVYGLGFIGALVYFIQHATNFTDGLIGFLKSLVWPALLVYKALENLKL